MELIEEADGFTILSGNGVRYPVEILSRKQNTYEILVNGVSYTFSVETPFSLKRTKLLASQKSTSKIENIKAPMPGKILDVMVTQGQTVNCGEALFVLEAMKMQNTITAFAKGIINKVTIKSGDTVGKDDLLVEIERI
jgi:biotin carboxyl carrier protein